jgi:hypothetical protein
MSHSIICERTKGSDMKDKLCVLPALCWLKYVWHSAGSTAWNKCKIWAFFGMKPFSLCQITLFSISSATGNYAALDIVIKRECEHSNTTAQTEISNVSVNWQLTSS